MRYWLMKSEPNCYGLDDLEKEGTNMWEGCRNYTVRNMFRDEMSVGDQAFFYHSNTKPMGVVGTMEIISEAYPDPTQFDPNSNYFDPKSSKDNPRWLVRDVRFTRRLPRCVTLDELKTTNGLEDMEVCRRGQRLSVLRVTKAEWEIVMKLSDTVLHE